MRLLIKRNYILWELPNYLSLSAKLNVLYLVFEVSQIIFKIIAFACNAKSFAMVIII